MKAVIMAGGKGTRIASIRNDVPKPMIEICGKPILQWQIECLKSQGITDITLVIGYLAHIIRDYFEDGFKYGVKITYIVEESPLGTAGALYYLKGKVEDDFFLINGDIMFDVDFHRFMAYHKENKGYATICTHPNSHPYDSGIVITDEKGRVLRWLHKEDDRQYYRNRVNAGIHIISPKVLEGIFEIRKMDLDRDILRNLITDRKLIAYNTPEYIKDMGTPDRYNKVSEDIINGVVKARNLQNKQKAVFLDRDGTINVYKGFLSSIDEIELIPGIEKTIKAINESGYLTIVVTNQPVIARGECSLEELSDIHNKIETLLGFEGAYLDDVFFCPHHPDKGFEGERIEYKIDCDCRKPKPGMLIKAAEKYNIDLSLSIMIGDDERDMQAGKAAGCICINSITNRAIGYEDIEKAR